jgi:hypothetical protein
VSRKSVCEKVGARAQTAERPLTRRASTRRQEGPEEGREFPGAAQWQSLLGNRALLSLLGPEAGHSGSEPRSCSCGGSCTRCSGTAPLAFERGELSKLPALPGALVRGMEARATETDEEEEQRVPSWYEAARLRDTEGPEGQERNGAAGIECDGSGGFRIDMGDWATAKCGIADCVRGHEQVHIDYRQKHYPDSCKNADGTSKTAGTKPTPLPADALRESECQAYTYELDCEEKLLPGATEECKKEINKMLDSPGWGTKAQKKKFCGGGC